MIRPAVEPNLPQNRKLNDPVCPHCQSQMIQTTREESNMTLQVLGVVVFLIGLGLCFTLIGAIIGIPLMISAARMGFSKFPVTACRHCGYYFKSIR